MPNLPSVEECQTFLATINKGREAIGLDALEKLDFDNAKPDSLSNCLSARNLFAAAGYDVLTTYVTPSRDRASDPHVFAAIGVSEPPMIPNEIRVVTDYFDACKYKDASLPELRARMVEAGVVA